MVDFENIMTTIVTGLKKYLKCPVIASNQNAEPPAYPYVSYTFITPLGANRGTYGIYEDGVARKPLTSTGSFSAQSDNSIECLTLANKARDWLDFAGTIYLNDNGVTVQAITDVTNRDNILTAEYEYKYGFDCYFNVMDEIDLNEIETEIIEKANITHDEGGDGDVDVTDDNKGNVVINTTGSISIKDDGNGNVFIG